MKAIGIDLGGTSIKSALVDEKNGIVDQQTIPTEAEKGPDHVMDRIAMSVNHWKTKAGDIRGVGIGSPGVISLDRTTVSDANNFPGWKVMKVSSIIESKTGLPCMVDNDANLMALGSSRFGVGQNYDHFIMLTIGTGVGGGIIFNRELYRGATGGAAELGHVTIDYNGAESNYPTRGGIEAYLGQRFLSRRAAEVIKKHPDNDLYKEFNGNYQALEPIHLTQEAEAGNELAINIWADAGEKLGYAIVNYIHILDIRTIIVSGGVAKAGKWLLEPARKTVKERMMQSFQKGFELKYEPLGNDAALLGAASLGLEI